MSIVYTSHSHRSSSRSLLAGSITSTTSSAQHLADIVVTAAQSRRTINKRSSSTIDQLRLSNMNLHGREDDIKLLREKLRELAKKNEEDAAKNNNDGKPNPNTNADNESNSNSSLILVSGTSGTGKSALIQRGLGDHAFKLGYTFTSGKFDEKLRCPLSAFSDAMTGLARHIIVEHYKKEKLSSGAGESTAAALIRNTIQNEFDEEDVEQLQRVLPGCVGLLRTRRHSLFSPLSEVRRPSGAAAPPLSLRRPSSAAAPPLRSASGPKLGGSKRRNTLVLAGKESISRMHYAIRRLLKIICSHLKGVVLFIDDLQWSDTTTLELLTSIVSDGEIPSLLIVGAYREDEVPDHHPLAFHIRDLEQMNVSVTQIKIGNLNVDDVRPLVAEALGMDDDDSKVKKLAETIHKKTEGNPFFVLMFLRSLYDEKLLQYNFCRMKWDWDDDAVNSKIVTNNVASVLVNKMNRLRDETQRMLMVASCLGATFRLSSVMVVMKNISRSDMRYSMRSGSGTTVTMAMGMGSSSSSLSVTSELSNSSTDRGDTDSDSDSGSISGSTFASSIEEFKEEGLCEVDNENCRFMHDQIQSAAFDLISPKQRDSFRGRIGRILLQNLSPQELEASLFEVVGLLNCAASKITDEERDELATMNLKAGIKASENAAFDTAKVYFKAGREALGSRGWEGDYTTMLDLCSDGANACYLTGDFDTMNELIDEVLSKDIDTKEKYRVSDIKVKSLEAEGKYNESIDAALDFRRQLGLPTPQKKPASKLIIMIEYIRVKRLLKNRTAEDIANLHELDDERHEMGQRMNEHLAISVYRVEPTMVPLIIFLMVTTSLQHGLNPSSSGAFASLGLLLCGPLGRPKKGCEMAKAAELILAKPGIRSSTSMTICITQSFCYHWTAPLHATIAPLLKGFQEGLEIGDTGAACSCLVIRIECLYFIGRSLDSIQHELEAAIEVVKQLKQDSRMLRIVVLLTTVKKLRGLDVEADKEKMDSLLAIAAATHNLNLAANIDTMKLEVFVFFQQWEQAIDLVRKAGNIRLVLSSAFSSVRYTFLEALTYLKATQSASGSKKRQMKKCAQKTIQLIRVWAKNGNVNVVHYLHILEAELAVLRGNKKKAKESFNAAIAASRKNGFIQDRAFAHEMASAHFKAQGDEFWRNHHMECAKTCYQEWGCDEKVEQLSLNR